MWRRPYASCVPIRGTIGLRCTHDHEETPLRADATAQLRLLDLQTVDSTLDSLKTRLRALPEQAELTALTQRRSEVAARHGFLQTEVSDLSREQRKADADAEQVKSRRSRNEDRITAGQVADPKQLQAMQHENESLGRRISDLEDAELEVMERLETAQQEFDRRTAELADLDQRIAEQTSARDTAATEIARQQTDALAEREQLAAVIPAELLALYDRLREHMGGVGVGALREKRCSGCRLEVGAAERARIGAAPADEVQRCEECNRILVRTAQSGV